MNNAEAARAALAAAIVRLGEGDRTALEHIYKASSAKLFGICYRILKDRKEAEDALQDVYINLWRRADRFDPQRASPISWLATMARNRAVDRLRAGGKVRAGAVDVAEAAPVTDSAPLADSMMIDAENSERIHHCMGTLEDRTRDAIRSAFFDGQTYAALAEAQDVPLGTMKSRVRRGLAKLKICLEADR